MLLGLRELANKLGKPIEDPDFERVADVILGGRDWALPLTMPGVFHGHQDNPVGSSS